MKLSLTILRLLVFGIVLSTSGHQIVSNEIERSFRAANESIKEAESQVQDSVTLSYAAIRKTGHGNVLGQADSLYGLYLRATTFIESVQQELWNMDSLQVGEEGVERMLVNTPAGKKVYRYIDSVFFMAKRYVTNVSLRQSWDATGSVFIQNTDEVTFTHTYFQHTMPVVAYTQLTMMQTSLVNCTQTALDDIKRRIAH